MWNPQILEIEYTANFKQLKRKVWQALVIISTSFMGTLILRELLRTLSWIDASRISRSPSSVGNLLRSSAPLGATGNDFLRQERTEDEISNVERNNKERIKTAKDQEGWKKMENKFAL